MEVSKLNYASPETHEAKRIADVKALSYEKRIKKLFLLIEVSFKIKNAIKLQSQK